MDNPNNGIVDFLEFGRPVNLHYEATLVMTMDNQASARAYPDHIDHYMKTGGALRPSRAFCPVASGGNTYQSPHTEEL